jgi:hypothetical protein
MNRYIFSEVIDNGYRFLPKSNGNLHTRFEITDDRHTHQCVCAHIRAGVRPVVYWHSGLVKRFSVSLGSGPDYEHCFSD